MTYYINRVRPIAFGEAIARTKEALKAEGFGVLTEINVQETLKSKIGIDFPKYVILGACNPALAHEALQLENKVGTMLPCAGILTPCETRGLKVGAMAKPKDKPTAVWINPPGRKIESKEQIRA